VALVDRLRSAKSKLEDKLLPAPVVYHHVPKCGGTSVGRALRQRYILSQETVVPEESFRAFEAFTGRTDRGQMLVDVLDLREQMMLYHLFRGVSCFSGHVRFSNRAFELFSSKYKFITILREPVARFISHYFWSHGKPGAHARIEEEFAPFLETERARLLGATYSEYFCGLPKDTDFSSDVAIAAAIENLGRLDVVGRLDDLADFEQRLRLAVGARIRIGHENKMRQTAALKTSVVTPELRKKVEALCAPDIAIWQAMVR
jgi:hypothetical protein